MQCPSHLARPLRSILKSLGQSTLQHASRRSSNERLFLIGCIGFAGVSGWQQRRFDSHAAVRADGEALPGDGVGGLGAIERRSESGSGAGVGFPGGLRGVDRLSCDEESDRVEGEASRAGGGGGGEGRAEEQGVSADEGTAGLEGALRITRLRVGKRKTRYYEGEAERRRGVEREGGAFAAVVEQASGRERDRGRGVRAEPQAKMRESFTPKYYHSVRRQMEVQQDKRKRRHQIQKERYGDKKPFTEASWLAGVLHELERATPDGAETHTRRMETVRLPEGVNAVFKDNAGEAILELMRRTGSHAQIMASRGTLLRHEREKSAKPRRGKRELRPIQTFNSVRLSGTVAQNAEAIRVLPELAQALSVHDLNVSKDLAEYIDRKEDVGGSGSAVVEPEVRKDERQLEDDDSLMERWHAEDIGNGSDDVHDGHSEDVGHQLELQLPHQASAGRPQDAVENEVPFVRAVWTENPFHAEQSLEYQLQRRRDINERAKPVTISEPNANANAKEAVARKSSSASADMLFIDRLSINSITSFAAYIDDITVSPSRLLSRRLTLGPVPTSGSPQTHTIIHQVTTELQSVFNDTACAPFISPEAVDNALQYLVQHTQFPAIRAVMSSLEQNEQYGFTASNFNILLGAAAKMEDVHNFQYVLHLMLQRRVKPTWRTWVRLHELVCRGRFPAEAAEGIVERMRRKGILAHSQAMREIVANGVEMGLSAHFRSGTDAELHDFIAQYDERWAIDGQAAAAEKLPSTNSRHELATEPRQWLTTSTANRMIKVLLSHGRTQDALTMVQKLEAAGEVPDTATLNTFLASASRARDVSAAVAALRYFEPAMRRSWKPIGLNERSFSMLFHVAWRGQWFNVSRVVWRYACCAGEVTWEMREKVRGSLVAYVPASASWYKREKVRREREAEEERKAAELGTRKRKNEAIEEDDGLLRMTSRNVFFGWAGKFAVGVGPANMPTAFSPDRHEAEILALSAQARSHGTTAAGAESMEARAEHLARKARLGAMMNADLEVTMSVRPTEPLVEVLEKAWKLDLEWKQSRLGVWSQEIEEVMRPAGLRLVGKGEDGVEGLDEMPQEKKKAEVFARMFEEMLREGVKVPVEIEGVGGGM